MAKTCFFKAVLATYTNGMKQPYTLIYWFIMKQPITGFHQDDQRHWVAELSCGHVQHVRHDPPLVAREWTQSSQGRQSMLGYILDCLKCDDGEPADEIKLRTMLKPKRANTILYCEKWPDTVAFYRDALGGSRWPRSAIGLSNSN